MVDQDALWPFVRSLFSSHMLLTSRGTFHAALTNRAVTLRSVFTFRLVVQFDLGSQNSLSFVRHRVSYTSSMFTSMTLSWLLRSDMPVCNARVRARSDRLRNTSITHCANSHLATQLGEQIATSVHPFGVAKRGNLSDNASKWPHSNVQISTPLVRIVAGFACTFQFTEVYD